MIRMILHGCGGAMGRAVTEMAESREDISIAAGIDITGKGWGEYPVYTSFADCGETADAVVDFASAKAVDGLLDYCGRTKTPVVLCTTGLSEEQQRRVEETAGTAAVLQSANMSLGVNLLLKLVEAGARALAPAGFDMEIVETHHSRKLDAPSGTAIALAEAANRAMGDAYHYVYDRSGRRQKRDPREIGISSVRGGSIVGEHDVIFAGMDEIVTLSHTAFSRSIFAKGALEAAVFLAGKEPGLYSMADVLGLQ